MGKYIIKRTFFAFLTLIAVVTITFFLMRSIPGDPLAGMARALPEETKQAFYAKYGLDKPLFEQYLIYMKGLFHGDLGESIRYAGRPVMKTIAETSPISGLYGGIALVLGTLTGVILGIVAALNKNRWPDYIVMFIAILGTTLPVFVLISLAQWVFGVKLGWLPPSGWGELKHMILPIAVSAFGSVATYARYVKASMLDTLDQDYVLTAKAKGLSDFQVITRHVLRNSLMPSVTIFAGSVVGVFTGAFVTERMFAIPGIGFYYISSINNNDYTMVLGTTVFYAVLFIVMQLVLDIVYTLIDPRIRVSGKK
ncbi:MAG: ABC transporter permease [Negativibacillus sp.]